MRIIMTSVLAAVMFFCTPYVSTAAVKTYVAEFNVIGVSDPNILKATLQSLLTSRLDSSRIKLVDKPENAEFQLFGNYAIFGKIFSIDVLVKNSSNGSLTKVFEQGSSQDDLIPAIGRLAGKLDKEIANAQTASDKAPAIPVITASVPAVAVIPVQPVIVKSEAQPVKTDENYIVKSDSPRRNTPGYWSSEPINGVFSAIALGRTMPAGEREIFIAGGNSVRYYHKGVDLKLIAEITMPASSKILAIDTADLDHDGIPEIFVSIIDRKTVSSKVYKPSLSGLELIKENQPWLYRGIGNDYKDRVVFVQAVSSNGEYNKEISELINSVSGFTITKTRTLPKNSNIYNFTIFKDSSGVDNVVVLDEDGYLVIYAANGNRLWKSSDKFGGSESFINYESVSQIRNTADKFHWNFLEQRIISMSDGILIVPRNDGTFNIGNYRSYNKHSLFGLQWGGVLLTEAWHTRPTPSYLADYAYDAATRELVLLEVVQKAGLLNDGKSIISINKAQ